MVSHEKDDGFYLVIGQSQAFEKVPRHFCADNAVVFVADRFSHVVHHQREIEKLFSRDFIVHAFEVLQVVGERRRPCEVVEVFYCH